MAKQDLSEFKNQIDIWRVDPVAFAYECLRLEFLTNQQEALLRQLGDFVFANTYQETVEEIEGIVFGSRYQQQQKRLANLQAEIEDIELSDEQKSYIRKAGFSVSSGRDTGKSCMLSIVGWWFLVCFERPQGFILAPTGQQAKAIMMAELALWGNRKIENEDTGEFERAFLFHDQFEMTSEAVRYKKDPNQRFIEVKRLPSNCSAEDQKAFLSGFHSKEQLWIIDEAVIFPDYVFETLNATNSRPLNWVMGIFNPIRPSSYAVRSVHGDKLGVYIPNIWNCEDSNKPGMRDQVAKLAEEYGGTNNDLYRVNVQGLPPEEGDDAFISMSMLEKATGSAAIFPKSNNVYVGHDVAGMGSDNSATVIRIGDDVRYIYTCQGKDEHYQASFLMDIYEEFHPKEINIDTIGIGKAVYVLLKHRIPNCVRPIEVSRKPTRDVKRYYNQRAQHYWKVREKLKNEEMTFNLREGKDQLIQLKRELLATERDKNGDPSVIKIEKKDKIKERLGGRSPDIADALMLSFCGRDYDQQLEIVEKKAKMNTWDRAFLSSKRKKPSNWMAV